MWTATNDAHGFLMQKTLSETSWGQSKETSLVTFKALVRLILDNANPIELKFFYQASNVQKAALRLITVCTKMSAIEHLYSESELFSLFNHHHHQLASELTLKYFSLSNPRRLIILFINTHGIFAHHGWPYTLLKLTPFYPKLILLSLSKVEVNEVLPFST